MAQKVQTESTPRRGRGWLRALLIGLGLFIATTIVLVLTGNPNLYPTVILIGNFLVPVVFVAFLYDHQHISSLSLDTVAASFCIGGVLGGAWGSDTRIRGAAHRSEPHSGSVPGWWVPCRTDRGGMQDCSSDLSSAKDASQLADGWVVVGRSGWHGICSPGKHRLCLYGVSTQQG